MENRVVKGGFSFPVQSITTTMATKAYNIFGIVELCIVYCYSGYSIVLLKS